MNYLIKTLVTIVAILLAAPKAIGIGLLTYLDNMSLHARLGDGAPVADPEPGGAHGGEGGSGPGRGQAARRHRGRQSGEGAGLTPPFRKSIKTRYSTEPTQNENARQRGHQGR